MKFIVVRCHTDNTNNDDSIVYKIGFESDLKLKYPMVQLLCPTFFLMEMIIRVEAPYGPEVVNEFKSREEAEKMIDRLAWVLEGRSMKGEVNVFQV